ncbi:MAG: hypothetical protein IT340_22450 [Chloroflexi bacterium]|nr:hypothetical protein [Chloroflexota bacterium]
MASARLVVDAIKRRCGDVEPRFDDYQEELLTTVVEILSREREHRISPTNIQQKVQDHIEVLGDQLWGSSERKA